MGISTSNPVEKSVPEVPAVPKKPVTAYIRYANEVRPDVMKKNPNMKVSEVAKLMGQMWKEVPTAKKEALTKAYQMDKEAYLKQFEQFKSTSEGQEFLEKQKLEKPEKKLKKAKSQLSTLKTEMGKPKRYPLAINLFASEQMKGMSGPVTDRIKVISEKWKNMSQEQKSPFVKKSDELKAIYEKELAHWEETVGKEGLSKLEKMNQKVISAKEAKEGKPKAKEAKAKAEEAKPKRVKKVTSK